jgi:hypothetical protein
MFVKFLSGSKQSDSSDDEDNVNADMICNKGHGQMLSNPFRPDLYLDLEDHDNPMGYFELFITPELADVISRETNWYAQQFLENMPNLKIRSRVHHWNNANREE